MKCTCTHCGKLIYQDQNLDGQNYCTNCGKLFLASVENKVPTWIWGVVAFMITNWQWLRTV
jgi:hypothetical protein